MNSVVAGSTAAGSVAAAAWPLVRALCGADRLHGVIMVQESHDDAGLPAVHVAFDVIADGETQRISLLLHVARCYEASVEPGGE